MAIYLQMHNGSDANVSAPGSCENSSLSAGSSSKSCSGGFARLAGESGEVANEELELGQRLCPRIENVGVIGGDAIDAPDEFRECPITWYVCDDAAAILLSLSSCLREVESLDSPSEGIATEL